MTDKPKVEILCADSVEDALEQIFRIQAKRSLQVLFNECSDRIKHFKDRLIELGYGPNEAAVIILEVDDDYGGQITEALFPGNEDYWQTKRNAGKIPIARGMAEIPGLRDALVQFDFEAANKLAMIKGYKCVVVGNSVAEVFEV